MPTAESVLSERKHCHGTPALCRNSRSRVGSLPGTQAPAPRVFECLLPLGRVACRVLTGLDARDSCCSYSYWRVRKRKPTEVIRAAGCASRVFSALRPWAALTSPGLICLICSVRCAHPRLLGEGFSVCKAILFFLPGTEMKFSLKGPFPAFSSVPLFFLPCLGVRSCFLLVLKRPSSMPETIKTFR